MAAQKLPFLPFYLTDWETDEVVKLMGPAARYCYLHLLMHQWREGSIPADRGELVRLLCFPSDYLTEIAKSHVDASDNWGILDLSAILNLTLSKFNPDPGEPGRLINPRLKAIYDDVRAERIAKSLGGAKTAATRFVAKPQVSPSLVLAQHKVTRNTPLADQQVRCPPAPAKLEAEQGDIHIQNHIIPPPYPPPREAEQEDSLSTPNPAELHLEMDLIAWMEKTWRENPRTRKTPWQKPKWPDGIRRREQELGAEAFRRLWVGHLGEHPEPGLREFLRAAREAANGGARPGESVAERDLRELNEALGEK